MAKVAKILLKYWALLSASTNFSKRMMGQCFGGATLKTDNDRVAPSNNT